jgi:hypothetical protein
MGEAAGRPEKPGGQRCDETGVRSRGLTERSHQDAFDPEDIDQVEGQSAAASLLQPRSTILLGQAHQLLSLPELGPGEVAGEKPLGQPADVRAKLLGLGHHIVGIAAGVGSEMLGVVVIVGRASAGLLRLVRLDQLSLVIDANERAVATNGDPLV